MASVAAERDEGTTTLYLRKMPTKLVREAKALAARKGVTLASLVTDALSVATGAEAGDAELPDELEDDAAWYEEHRGDLVRRYRGRYVAIVDRRVIDHDVDFGSLARRVFAKVGRRPVLMPRCLPDERVVHAPSPRVARR